MTSNTTAQQQLLALLVCILLVRAEIESNPEPWFEELQLEFWSWKVAIDLRFGVSNVRGDWHRRNIHADFKTPYNIHGLGKG